MNAWVTVVKVMKCCVCVFDWNTPNSSVTKKTGALQIIICLINWWEIWIQKNILTNEKKLEGTLNLYSEVVQIFLQFFIIRKIEI